MDNRQFDITDRLDGTSLEAAIEYAMRGEQGVRWYLNEPPQSTNDNPAKLIRLPRLTFLFTHVEYAGGFLTPRNSTDLAREARLWLDGLPRTDYGPRPFSSDDGSVGVGFHLWLGMFGRTDEARPDLGPAAFAIEPCWAWYHK